MYPWLRNTHLVLGLFSVLFLLVYGLSAAQMAHRSWFSGEPRITEKQFTIKSESANNPRALARELMDSHGLRGELEEVRETSEGCELHIARPGTEFEVKYSRVTGEIRIRTRAANFMGMLNALHHVAGFRRGSSLTGIWAGLVAIISAALVLLGLTGIYLWFKIYSERVVGVVLLVLSLTYSLTLIILLRTA